MMDTNNEFFDDSFIGKWLSGDLSPAQKKEFENWLKTYPDNKTYFDNLACTWRLSQKIELQKGRSGEDRWNALATRLYLAPGSKQASNFRRYAWKVASIAAILILMISISFWVFNRHVVTISASSGMHQVSMLPDGSQVTLNAKSAIRYNKKTWEKDRHIMLKGEAFFEVLPGKPFSVSSGFVTTCVLGTSFNIRSRGDKVEVACITGKVRVQSKQKKHMPVILIPGFASQVTKDNLPCQPFEFNIDQKLGWISNEYYFTHTPLKEVFAEIERQYDIHIIVKKDFGNLTFTGYIEGTDIRNALDIICSSSGLNFTMTKDSTVTIY